MRRVNPIAARTAAALLTGTVLATAGADDARLQPFDAVYEVRIKGLRGEMTMSLAGETGTLTAQSTLRARGLASLLARGSIEEYAEFDVSPAGLLPQRYRSSDTLAGDDGSIEMQFDWTNDAASGREDGEDFEHPADGRTYDRVTLQYGLMLDLLNDRLGDNYVLLDGRKYKELTVTHLGRKSIEVPLGTFDAIGIAHQSENSSRVTTLWCAPELSYLPVRIEQHRKGKLNVRAELAEYVPATPGVSAPAP